MIQKMLLMLTLIGCVQATEKGLLFIGLDEKKMAEYRDYFTQQVQTQWSNDSIKLLPAVTAARLRDQLFPNGTFFMAPEVSRYLLDRGVDSTALILWPEVTNFSLEPERKWVVLGGITGNLAIRWHLYEVGSGKQLLSEEVLSKVQKGNTPVLWYKIGRVVQLSAPARDEYSRKLIDDATTRGVELLLSVVPKQK